jgi:hypothetical protein
MFKQAMGEQGLSNSSTADVSTLVSPAWQRQSTGVCVWVAFRSSLAVPSSKGCSCPFLKAWTGLYPRGPVSVSGELPSGSLRPS